VTQTQDSTKTLPITAVPLIARTARLTFQGLMSETTRPMREGLFTRIIGSPWRPPIPSSTTTRHGSEAVSYQSIRLYQR